jgi:hypothetical protein
MLPAVAPPYTNARITTSPSDADDANPPERDVRLTVTAPDVPVPVAPPTNVMSVKACEPDGDELGELEGDELGLFDGLALGELEGEEDGEAELEPEGLLLGDDDGEEEDVATRVITCAALTKLAFSKMSNSSIFKAAPSIRVFSSRIIPP